ncbi:MULTISPECIES: hypothetical protein [unclassified Sinorhizobium]|uniref:hypothetical protein n=1 Tax=unclassified Sinorhizobium TaxID=2613772 RepID=UPI0024C3D6D1|nr:MULTISPECIES: hypothetical protein [unclassified Sinorhizobium]MDK1378196.1 hypothetical protein [Sinorhizobium sp. 6-70]MDK1483007.1 hypothetical protein [Sinorhizobium sp. 6-117]
MSLSVPHVALTAASIMKDIQSGLATLERCGEFAGMIGHRLIRRIRQSGRGRYTELLGDEGNHFFAMPGGAVG